MDVRVRGLTEADFPGYLALVEELDVQHREALPERFRAGTGPARSMDYYRSILADLDVALLGAERAGECAGFVHLLYRAPEPRFEIQVPRKSVVIENLIVATRHRRAGVARALMDAAHDWARKRGADTVELSVYEFNAGARAFYEECGYQPLTRTLARRI